MIPYEQIKDSPILKKYTNQSKLESSLNILSFGFLLASVFFMSDNFTGNVIAEIPNTSLSYLGIGFLLAGLIILKDFNNSSRFI